MPINVLKDIGEIIEGGENACRLGEKTPIVIVRVIGEMLLRMRDPSLQGPDSERESYRR